MASSEVGYRAWFVVLTLWTRDISGTGVVKGLGVLLPKLEEQLATQTWVLGLIISLIIAVQGFSAILVKLSDSRCGDGYAVMLCAGMIGTSFIAGSFVQNALQLGWILIPLAGIGLGVSNILLKEHVSRLFTENYATANGISRTGYSIGLIVYAPLVQVFLTTYGWRGAMLLNGGILMHLAVCGALTATIRMPEIPRTNYVQLPDPSSPGDQGVCCGGLLKKLFAKFDVEVLFDVRFYAVALIRIGSNFAVDMWAIYFVSQVLDNGYTTHDAGTFVAFAGVGNFISKVLQGPITDRGLISNSSLMAIFTVVATVAFCATPWQISYWIVLTSSFMVGFSDGILACQVDVFLVLVIEPQLLRGAFAWLEVTYATAALAFGFLPGWLADTTGNFIAPFLFIGFVQGATIFPIMYLKLCGYVK